MKICVINGSPKGKNSISLNAVKYIQKEVPSIEFDVHHISHKISFAEKNTDYLEDIVLSIQSADALMFVFGVWVLHVPAQLIRFFELIRERGLNDILKGKYAVSLII